MFDKVNIWTKPTYKVLQTLTKDPNEQYHVRAIARKSDISPSSASNILKDLEKNDILKKEIIGRQTFYKPRMKNPIVRQFKVFDNILDLYDLFSDIKDLSEKIVLFGSASEGTDTEESDIDLFIITKEPKKVGSEVKKEEKVSPIIIEPEDLIEFKKENEALYENVKSGIELWNRENEL